MSITHHMWRFMRVACGAALVVLATGCATVSQPDPRDPLEGFNRTMFRFNDEFDKAIATPLASAYQTLTPDPVRDRVRNFFENVRDLMIGVNNLAQGKPEEAMDDLARVMINSTVGLFGLHDIASEAGIDKHDEDFGQTFGRWGVPSGAYIVWPFFGPSTVRDSVGLALDIRLAPLRNMGSVRLRNSLFALRQVSVRADLLDAGRLLEQAALDTYVFQRDAFLQRRRSQIYDGRPPRDEPRSAVEPEAVRVAGARDAPVIVAPNVFEPRIPSNYQAVMADRRKPQ